MTIFALEQAVSNGCQLDITEAESALEEVAALRDENERLRVQLAEAQKDSERLDWIDKQTYEGANPRGNVWMVGWKGHAMHGLNFRSAIDAAKGD